MIRPSSAATAPLGGHSEQDEDKTRRDTFRQDVGPMDKQCPVTVALAIQWQAPDRLGKQFLDRLKGRACQHVSVCIPQIMEISKETCQQCLINNAIMENANPLKFAGVMITNLSQRCQFIKRSVPSTPIGIIIPIVF